MSRRISQLEKQILANLQIDWTLEKLAEITNVANSQLTKIFHTELEISPVRFVKNVRLEKARELLETTFLLVKEIMFAVGIKDQSHFVRDFKKKYGATPTEYRNRHHEKLEAAERPANESVNPPTNERFRQ